MSEERAPRLRSASDDPRSPSGVEGTTPTPAGIDLRILTPGLSEEEIAAVTSVVSAIVEEQAAARKDDSATGASAGTRRWRHSLGPFANLSRR